MKSVLFYFFLISFILLFDKNIYTQIPINFPKNGLVGYWPFSGNANDISGNGNNGIVNGARLSSDRFGNSNSAYSFDGSNWIELNSLPLINNSKQLAVSIWVKSTGNNNSNCSVGCAQYFFGRGSDGLNGFHIATLQGEKSKIFGSVNGSFGGQTCIDPSVTKIPYSEWVHIILNYDGNSIKLYRNAELIGSTPYSLPVKSDNTKAAFGRCFTSGFPYFTVGLIDDGAIWNRVLTIEEIKRLYQIKMSTEVSNNTISTPNNNNNKTWVHSKGKFERSNEKNPKGELIWTEDNGRLTYFESSYNSDKKEYNLYRKNEPNVKLVISDKSIYYYDNNNVKGFLLFNGGWEKEDTKTISSTNSTSNQEAESKTIGKNETSIISFEEFKTKANNIADVNERFKYRVEIMNLAKNTDIKLLPRHISSFCFDIYECIGNGSFNKIESRFCELGKTLTEISCEAILTDGLEKDVNKEVFKFNSLIYVFCSAKISTSREAYNMKIINGILNNYTAETYYNEFYKNLKDLFTDEKKANSSQYQVNLEKYVTTQLEKVKQSYSDARNNMYSNGRKFSQSEYQQDYKCKYCPDGKIIGGWKNGVDEKKKKYDPYYNYVGEEEMYTPQYLRKRFPYCSPKCAKEDNE
jgi:hypothetical protein